MIYRDAAQIARCDSCDALATDKVDYTYRGCIPGSEREVHVALAHKPGCSYLPRKSRIPGIPLIPLGVVPGLDPFIKMQLAERERMIVEMKPCWRCQAETFADEQTCSDCGAPISEAQMEVDSPSIRGANGTCS